MPAVAASYRREQHSLALGWQLVGPVLFPVYARVLAINVGLTVLVSLTLAMTLKGYSAANAATAVLWQALLQFAIVRFIFALAERMKRRTGCVSR